MSQTYAMTKQKGPVKITKDGRRRKTANFQIPEWKLMVIKIRFWIEDFSS
ncbi:MAG TPA: hypothetical protein VJ844_03905 [Mucilaginibacter sp.]|nr:hypothetical protein [Mucilaginibacter sp.]